MGNGFKINRHISIHKILERLEYNNGIFPHEALVYAIDNRKRITPELLKIIRLLKINAYLMMPKIYMAHIYAMFLLAQFREKRAYPLIVDFFSPGSLRNNFLQCIRIVVIHPI